MDVLYIMEGLHSEMGVGILFPKRSRSENILNSKQARMRSFLQEEWEWVLICCKKVGIFLFLNIRRGIWDSPIHLQYGFGSISPAVDNAISWIVSMSTFDQYSHIFSEMEISFVKIIHSISHLMLDWTSRKSFYFLWMSCHLIIYMYI